MSRLLIATPLGIEARALRAGARGARVLRTGMGARRARAAARTLASQPAGALAIAGFCGALDPGLRAGDVVVASELWGAGEPIACPAAPVLAGELRRQGIRAHCGPLLSDARLVGPRRRAALASTGALAVDMESAWLAEGAGDRPLAVVRVVVDSPGHELYRPLATLRGGLRALRTLRRTGVVLEQWATALRPRTLLLAAPRAACAGVDRAIEIVEAALRAHGAPLYVRHQIVHNSHVVADLQSYGVVFIDELAEVPRGSSVVFSAHGVSPAVRREAGERGLDVIDATCPLVSKVHAEARRFAQRGNTIVLVGHRGHVEVEGVIGEAPERTQVVEGVEAAREVAVEDPQRVAYLTQTTLAVDDTADVIGALRERFPALEGPPSADICYATQNRQDAVRELARKCDRILVIGSANSSNSNRLAEVAERAGAPARLIEDETRIDLDWVAQAGTLGLTAGASAREALVQRVAAALEGLGPLRIQERVVVTETMHFKPNAGSTRRG